MIAEALSPLRVPIESLVPDPANARQHDEKNIEAIAASLRRFGQLKPIVVRAEDRIVVAGNGTLIAAKRLGWKEIAAVVAPLEKIDAAAFAIADNRTAELADWDEDALRRIVGALDDELRDVLCFSEDELADLARDPKDEPNPYTREIQSPIYEPSGERPDVSSLFDDSKTRELLEAIDAARIADPELRRFLVAAAQRFTVIRFDRAADLYAHSTSDVQRLFERLALVIVDMNRAIEFGFVAMHQEIESTMRSEEAEGDEDDD